MKILVRPRIHITLISMHRGGYRANGGIGFALEEPKAILTIDASKNFDVRDQRRCGFSQSELLQLGAAVSEAKSALKLNRNIQVRVEGEMRTHYGMGSATAIRLAVLEGLLTTNKKKIDRKDLVALSKRGGTSGIGIN